MVAGLDAVAPLIIAFFRGFGIVDEFIGVGIFPGVPHVVLGHGVGLGVDNLPQGLVFQGGAGDDSHVPGGGVMVFIVVAVGVGKMGARAAQYIGGLIHQIHKGGNGAADRLGDDVCTVVGGFEHGHVDKIQQVHLFPGHQPGAGAVLRHGQRRGRTDRCFGNIRHRQRQISGHDLGGGGGIHHRVCVFFKNNVAGVLFDQDAGLRVQVLGGQVFRMRRVIVGSQRREKGA